MAKYYLFTTDGFDGWTFEEFENLQELKESYHFVNFRQTEYSRFNIIEGYELEVNHD